MEKQILKNIKMFVKWLDSYGEVSQDHQDFYAGGIGRAAKALYYRKPLLGTVAVLPMVICEAFIPQARKYFYPPMRLPIADAHYAMGFALLYKITKDDRYYNRAVHFLEILKNTRCSGYKNYGWGYPFHWQTRGGLIKAGTPLITTTPYCYEAFDYVYQIDKNNNWREIMESIALHVLEDYMDFEAGPNARSCSYTPLEREGGVINASAYRAFLLIKAWKDFGKGEFIEKGYLNLNFVLQNQQENGSWPYAIDGIRNFVDHFHTCFVLKALAKIELMTDNKYCSHAIDRGIAYYLNELFYEDGLPKPFAQAPRLTVYRAELYDCAECINLGVLLRGRFPELDKRVDGVVGKVLDNWQKPDGSFRSRRLFFGWDNVPMHRWGQSQIFRSLCLYLYKEKMDKEELL